MMLSEDFGETWSSLHLQLEDDEVLEIAVHPEDTGTYAVGTLNEDIFETKDGGITWKQLARAGEPLAEE